MLAPILAAATTTDPVTSLLTQGGVLSVVIAGMVAAGRWVYNRLAEAHARELAARDAEIARLEAEVATLRANVSEAYEFTRDRTVPALTSTGEALVRSTEINREYLQHLARGAR